MTVEISEARPSGQMAHEFAIAESGADGLLDGLDGRSEIRIEGAWCTSLELESAFTRVKGVYDLDQIIFGRSTTLEKEARERDVRVLVQGSSGNERQVLSVDVGHEWHRARGRRLEV